MDDRPTMPPAEASERAQGAHVDGEGEFSMSERKEYGTAPDAPHVVALDAAAEVEGVAHTGAQDVSSSAQHGLDLSIDRMHVLVEELRATMSRPVTERPASPPPSVAATCDDAALAEHASQIESLLGELLSVTEEAAAAAHSGLPPYADPERLVEHLAESSQEPAQPATLAAETPLEDAAPAADPATAEPSADAAIDPIATQEETPEQVPDAAQEHAREETSDATVEPTADAPPEPVADAMSPPDTEPAPALEPEPAPQPDPLVESSHQSEAQTEVQPEAPTEVQPEVQTEVQTEVQPEAQPEAQPEPAPELVVAAAAPIAAAAAALERPREQSASSTPIDDAAPKPQRESLVVRIVRAPFTKARQLLDEQVLPILATMSMPMAKVPAKLRPIVGVFALTLFIWIPAVWWMAGQVKAMDRVRPLSDAELAALEASIHAEAEAAHADTKGEKDGKKDGGGKGEKEADQKADQKADKKPDKKAEKKSSGH